MKYIKTILVGFCCYLIVAGIPSFVVKNYTEELLELLENIQDDYIYYVDFVTWILCFLFYFLIRPKKFKLVVPQKLNLKVVFSVIMLSVFLKLFDYGIWNVQYYTKPYEGYELYDFPLSFHVVYLGTMSFLGPIVEELFNRKLMLNYFHNDLWTGILFTSFVFALTHLGVYHDFPNIFMVFYFGIVCCFIYLKYGLVNAIIFHAIYNLIGYFFKYAFNSEFQSLTKMMSDSYYFPLFTFISLVLFFLLFFRLWNKNDFKKWIYTNKL